MLLALLSVFPAGHTREVLTPSPPQGKLGHVQAMHPILTQLEERAYAAILGQRGT